MAKIPGPEESAATNPRPWSVDLTKSDWKQLRWRSGIRRTPAVVLCLILGIVLKQPLAGVVAAGAALSTGLGGYRPIFGTRALGVILTPLIIALSAYVGTLVGGSAWLNPLTVAVWGAVFALLTIHDDHVGWLAMQGTVALVVATAFPGHPMQALERALALAAGGALQGVFLFLCWWAQGISFHEAEEPDAEPDAPVGPGLPWNFAETLNLRSLATRYAVRVALTMVAATETARHLPLHNSYWLPMTTIIVLKPDFYRTYSSGVQRVFGTLLGVIAASLIAHFFHPDRTWLIALVGGFAFLCFALLKVNAVSLAAALTAYVVCLIATTGLPAGTVTVHRLINTALGCGLALVSRMVGISSLAYFFRHEAPAAPEAPAKTSG